MNKAELISAIAEKAGITKSDANKAMDAFMEVTGDLLKNGDRLTLVGFGTIYLHERPAGMIRNPQTGLKMKVEAKKFVKIKAGANLTRKVN
ncbi:MAG: HU family DNA-binding protein [Bacteroidales bacterium]